MFLTPSNIHTVQHLLISENQAYIGLPATYHAGNILSCWGAETPVLRDSWHSVVTHVLRVERCRMWRCQSCGEPIRKGAEQSGELFDFRDVQQRCARQPLVPITGCTLPLELGQALESVRGPSTNHVTKVDDKGILNLRALTPSVHCKVHWANTVISNELVSPLEATFFSILTLTN